MYNEFIGLMAEYRNRVLLGTVTNFWGTQTREVPVLRYKFPEYRIFSNLIRTSFFRFLKRKKKLSSRF